MNKITINFLIFFLIFLALVFRILAFYFFADTQLVNEWKILIYNLSERGTLGFYVINEGSEVVSKMANENETVLPSVFMPPLYAYYIFIIQSIFLKSLNFINIIIFSQIILSLISIYIFFRLLKKDENLKIVLATCIIFSLIPINVYSTVQISSVSIQVFLLTCFFLLLKKFSIDKKFSTISLFLFSIISGFLILLRGEFIFFFFLTLIYFFVFFSKNIKILFISILISMIVISPYISRNYYHFNTITITKSFGYNLLKGNNKEFKVEGNPSFIEREFNRNNLNIKLDKKYEINLDNFYKERALEYIIDNPKEFLLNYFKKVFAFLFLDMNSSYKNYYNLFHIIPKIMLSFFSIFGAIIVLRKKGFLQYLSLYFFCNIFLFSIFFILPRYSLILLPVQILLSLESIKFLFRKFFN